MVRAFLILFLPVLIVGAALGLGPGAGVEAGAGAGLLPSDEWRDRIVRDLRPGDLVFRRGRGGVSDAIAIASGSALAWTHVGIVVQPPSFAGPLVLHAIDGRGVVIDPPERFFSEIEASAGAVVRLRGGAAAAQHALAYAGRPFDHSLAMSEQDRLYCTELVVVALRAAGVVIDPPLRRLPLVSEPVLMPDDLYRVVQNYRSTETQN